MPGKTRIAIVSRISAIVGSSAALGFVWRKTILWRHMLYGHRRDVTIEPTDKCNRKVRLLSKMAWIRKLALIKYRYPLTPSRVSNTSALIPQSCCLPLQVRVSWRFGAAQSYAGMMIGLGVVTSSAMALFLREFGVLAPAVELKFIFHWLPRRLRAIAVRNLDALARSTRS